jgi:4-alpha-glucanotransferase
MNHPGTVGNGNWQWRLGPGDLTDAAARRLRDATAASGRVVSPRAQRALAASAA